jgi:hypothetical protein
MISDPPGKWGDARSRSCSPANPESVAASEERSRAIPGSTPGASSSQPPWPAPIKTSSITRDASPELDALSLAQQSIDTFDDVATAM